MATSSSTPGTERSDQNDVDRLVSLLVRQRELLQEMKISPEGPDKGRLRDEWLEIRNGCMALVDRYFRETLRPVLAKRFPNKGIQAAALRPRAGRHDAAFRYTELVADFFVNVLSRFDDPFWK